MPRAAVIHLSVGDLKKIHSRLQTDYFLSLSLFSIIHLVEGLAVESTMGQFVIVLVIFCNVNIYVSVNNIQLQ